MIINALTTPLEDLDFSPKTFNFVKSLHFNMHNAGDLIAHTKEDLLKHRNATDAIIKEIKDSLERINLKLKPSFGLDDDIKRFNFSPRLANKLHLHGITTLRDVLNKKEKILNIEQLGAKSISELEILFDELGIETNLVKAYQEKEKQKKLKRKKSIMKVEIVKKTEFNKNPWYAIEVDGVYLTGTYEFYEINELYSKILEDPKIVESCREILKSNEIDVTS